MKEIVIFKGCGSYEFDMSKISHEGFELFCKKAGLVPTRDLEIDLEMEDLIRRDSKILVEVIRELGERAVYHCDHAEIAEVPDDAKWIILCDRNGNEYVVNEDYLWISAIYKSS